MSIERGRRANVIAALYRKRGDIATALHWERKSNEYYDSAARQSALESMVNE